MAIAPISGSVPAQPVRASMAPIEGVSGETKKKTTESTIIAQENKSNMPQTGVANNKIGDKFDDFKGVEKVDINA